MVTVSSFSLLPTALLVAFSVSFSFSLSARELSRCSARLLVSRLSELRKAVFAAASLLDGGAADEGKEFCLLGLAGTE